MQNTEYFQPDKSGPLDFVERIEKLLTLSAIAAALGLPAYTVRRAAKNGEFRTYRVGKGHSRARLSEVLSAVEDAARRIK